MLTIRRAQMDSMNRSMRQQLGREVVESLPPHTIQGLSKAEVDERLHTSIEKADKYGFQVVRDLQAFVRLSFEIGPNFDDYPKFQTIFQDIFTPPDYVMSQLFKEATDRDWVSSAVFDIVSRSRNTNSSEKLHGELHKPFPDDEELRDSKPVSLEPLELKHAEKYFWQSLHPDVWRLADLEPFLCLEDAEQFILSMQTNVENNGYAIIDSKAEFVGATLVEHIGHVGQLSYWVGRSFWGQGIATKAVREQLKILREQTHITRVMAETFRGNLPSIRVVEKCGFTQINSEKINTTDILNFYCNL